MSYASQVITNLMIATPPLVFFGIGTWFFGRDVFAAGKAWRERVFDGVGFAGCGFILSVCLYLAFSPDALMAACK